MRDRSRQRSSRHGKAFVPSSLRDSRRDAALAAITGTAVAAPAAHVDRVALTIESDTQHGKKDAKGKWHDAYLPAAFSATTGDNVVVTIRNFDPAPHTFTAKKLGLNVVV